MKKRIQEIKINISTLGAFSTETLLKLKGECMAAKAGSFIGAVKKQYYIKKIESVLKLRDET